MQAPAEFDRLLANQTFHSAPSQGQVHHLCPPSTARCELGKSQSNGGKRNVSCNHEAYCILPRLSVSVR
jgi:hypothetical protein